MPGAGVSWDAGGSGWPFLVPSSEAPVRYQEFYDPADMDMPFGVHYITAVRFRLSNLPRGSLDVIIADVHVRLGVQAHEYPYNDFDNLGPEAVAVHERGPLHLAADFVPNQPVQPFAMELPLSAPLVYDRSWGPLVLDVINYSGIPNAVSPSFEVARDADVPGLYDSVFSLGGFSLTHGTPDTKGLVTEFVYQPVPEPSPLVLAILATGLAVGCRSRPRRTE